MENFLRNVQLLSLFCEGRTNLHSCSMERKWSTLCCSCLVPRRYYIYIYISLTETSLCLLCVVDAATFAVAVVAAIANVDDNYDCAVRNVPSS